MPPEIRSYNDCSVTSGRNFSDLANGKLNQGSSFFSSRPPDDRQYALRISKWGNNDEFNNGATAQILVALPLPRVRSGSTLAGTKGSSSQHVLGNLGPETGVPAVHYSKSVK